MRPKFLDYVYISKPKAKLNSAMIGKEYITNHKKSSVIY